MTVSVAYTFFKHAHPLLSFQSWHLLSPRHPAHRFPAYKHPPVTTHHALTIVICDRAINLIPSLQIHVFTWQQSPPGRISQWLSVSRTRDSPVNGASFTHSKSGEIQGYSKSMKWGISPLSKSHTVDYINPAKYLLLRSFAGMPTLVLFVPMFSGCDLTMELN